MAAWTHIAHDSLSLPASSVPHTSPPVQSASLSQSPSPAPHRLLGVQNDIL